MLPNTPTLACLLLALFISLTTEMKVVDPNLELVKQWNVLSYNFPWNWPQHEKTLYNPEKIVMTGVEVDRDRLFVSTPRLYAGVPATLSVISRYGYESSPVLQPYPDWSHHTAGLKMYNCSDLGLVSVYRVRMDSCNRLWVLDAGVSRSFEDAEKTCPPKILVYDVNTDKVVKRIDFPHEVLRRDSLLTNLVIDETSSVDKYSCDDLFVYITDTVVPAIIVYDSANSLTWRTMHPAMHPDPTMAPSDILGENFTLADGIIGLALDPDTNTVYFQPYATDRIFSVPIKSLRSYPRVNEVLPNVRLVGHKSSQGIGLAVAPTGGSLFFSPVRESAIVKWNPNTNHQEVLVTDSTNLQFTAELRVTDKDPGALWLMSSRFHKVFLNTLNPQEVNIRIMRIPNVVEQKDSHNTIIPTHSPLIKFPSRSWSNYFSDLFYY